MAGGRGEKRNIIGDARKKKTKSVVICVFIFPYYGPVQAKEEKNDSEKVGGEGPVTRRLPPGPRFR